VHLAPEERATAWIAHELGYVAELADEVEELAPVTAAMCSANGSLNNHQSNFDVLVCYVDSDYVEQQLALVIRDLSLQKGTDIPITPGELHKMVVTELQRFAELRLQWVYEFLMSKTESWAERVIEPLTDWEPNGGYRPQDKEE